MAQAWKANRRNIETRMANRGNRTGAKSAEQQAAEAGVFAKRVNQSAEIAWQTFKREAKRVGRLDKFSKRYVGA